ncbi:MAG: serine/threonine-protein kinase [Deltaproteobacteria bacterium]
MPEEPPRRVCERCCAVYRTAYSRCPLDGGHLVYRNDDPLVGGTLGGRYVIIECVGEGAMGRVYRARHNRVSRMFAVKVLFGDLAANEQMRARFAREAEAASRLTHPNVVSVVDFGETDAGLLYIAMEFIEGKTLGQMVREKGRLEESDVRALGIEILHGLTHAHEAGLVHRDLKPENIIVVKQGSREVPKIVDFGVAFLDEGNRSQQDARLTQSGCIVGTPSFMAPEQALGESVGPTADLFSFGVCLYYALAGRAPFDGEAVTVLQRLMCDPIPPVVDRAPDAEVSPAMQSLLDKLTERAVEDRFQTCEEVIAALEGLDGEPAAMTAPSHAGDSSAMYASVQRGPAPMLIGLAAICVIGLGAAGYLVTRSEAKETKLVELRENTSPTRGLPERANPSAEAQVDALDAELDALEGADEPATLEPPEPEPAAAKPAEAETPAPVEEAPAAAVKRAPPRRRPAPSVVAVPKKQAEAKTTPKEAAPPKPPAPTSTSKPAAKTAPKSTPKVEEAPAIPPVSELRERYLRVGQALERLGARRGDDVADPLRTRYFKIPYATAQRVPSVRRDVVETLRQLEREIAAK